MELVTPPDTGSQVVVWISGASSGIGAALAASVPYDGARISGQLLATDDFVELSARPLGGPAAGDKGMALFPRRIGGRYAALCRADGATNARRNSAPHLGRADHRSSAERRHRGNYGSHYPGLHKRCGLSPTAVWPTRGH